MCLVNTYTTLTPPGKTLGLQTRPPLDDGAKARSAPAMAPWTRPRPRHPARRRPAAGAGGRRRGALAGRDAPHAAAGPEPPGAARGHLGAACSPRRPARPGTIGIRLRPHRARQRQPAGRGPRDGRAGGPLRSGTGKERLGRAIAGGQHRRLSDPSGLGARHADGAGRRPVRAGRPRRADPPAPLRRPTDAPRLHPQRVLRFQSQRRTAIRPGHAGAPG